MNPTTAPVELLERAVSYARGALCGVGLDLGRPTPCRQWDLRQLLDHMDDSLDSFLQASGGAVSLAPVPSATTDLAGPERVGVLQRKACALIGAWVTSDPPRVRLGEAELAPRTVLLAGAVEIAVHGWDVATTTGQGPALPEALAEDLHECAEAIVSPADRGVRFADPLPVSPACGPADRLLAFLGRAR